MSFDRLDQFERSAMAERLKAARNVADKTIRGVAEEMGVNVNSVVQWERGSVPGPETRARLAALYGIAEDVLFAEVAAREAEARQLLRPA